MSQAFITCSGKIDLNDKRLLISHFKLDFLKTAVGELLAPMLIVISIVICFLDRKNVVSFLITIVILLLIFSSSLRQLCTILFRKSYSNYIPLNRIISFELKPDKIGLETEVRLYLKNGRYRSIMFRTLEKQYEPFIELLSSYLPQPQLA